MVSGDRLYKYQVLPVSTCTGYSTILAVVSKANEHLLSPPAAPALPCCVLLGALAVREPRLVGVVFEREATPLVVWKAYNTLANPLLTPL